MTVRVLALCGYGQNATGFARQCTKALLGGKAPGAWEALPAPFQKLGITNQASEEGMLGQIKATSPSGAEVTFIDPTLVLAPEQLAKPHLKELESYSSFPNASGKLPRAWWTAPDRSTYKREFPGMLGEFGYDDTVKYLHAYLTSAGPFDGVIGFSQGAAMAIALAGLLEKPGLHPDFPTGSNLQPLKFAIAVGGFKPRSENPDFTNYFPLNTPVLHVMGKKDPIVSEKAGKQLVDACPNSRVEHHEGGHYVPGTVAWAELLDSYISTMGNGGKATDVAPLAETARL